MRSIVSGFDQGQIKDSGVSQWIRTKIILNTTNMKFIIHLCQINRVLSYLSIVLEIGHFEVAYSTGREIYLGIC